MTAADRLYAALMALREKLEPLPNTASHRRRLGATALGVSAGAFSDFKVNAGSEVLGTQKHQLASILLNDCPDAIADETSALCADIEMGVYADEPPGEELCPPLDVDEMPPSWRRVFTWVYRYTEVYGQSPTMMEIAVSLEAQPFDVQKVLKSLVSMGAIRKESGRRCWVPTRIP